MPFFQLPMWRLLTAVLTAASAADEYLPRHGWEADGSFKHVAGSACCHPAADPWPIAGGQGECESRCQAYEPCDAFIFSPATSLCWLIRYTERAKGGHAKEPAIRPAEDRVFGLVQREGSPSSKHSAGKKKRTTRRTAKEQRRGKAKARGRHPWGSCGAAGAGERGFGNTLEGCFSFGDSAGIDVEMLSADDLFGDAAFGGLYGDRSGTKEDFQEFVKNVFSKANFSQEDCFANEGICDAEAFVILEEDEEHCVGASSWRERFREAKAHLWPDEVSCQNECSRECAADLEEVRRQALKAATELAERLFGPGEDFHVVEMDEPGAEAEDVVCQAACQSLCSDLVRPPNRTAGRRWEDRHGRCSEEAGTDWNTSDIAERVASAVDAAFGELGLKLQGVAPAFLQQVPEVISLESLALASAYADSAPGGIGLPDIADVQPLPGASVVDPLDAGRFFQELAVDIGDGSTSAIATQSADGDQALQATGRSAASGPSSATALPGLPVPFSQGDGPGAHIGLHRFSEHLPLQLPQTARWMAGSPPFLERFRARTLSRLSKFFTVLS